MLIWPLLEDPIHLGLAEYSGPDERNATCEEMLQEVKLVNVNKAWRRHDNRLRICK